MSLSSRPRMPSGAGGCLPLSPMTRILGFDIGARWLGIAAGDEALRIAFPRPEHRLADGEDPVAVIAALVAQERAGAVVIGMPYTLRGERGPQALEVERLVEALKAALPCPVHIQDERLTSVQAKAAAGGRRDDSAAAALVLQTWFDRQISAPKGVSDTASDD